MLKYMASIGSMFKRSSTVAAHRTRWILVLAIAHYWLKSNFPKINPLQTMEIDARQKKGGWLAFLPKCVFQA